MLMCVPVRAQRLRRAKLVFWKVAASSGPGGRGRPRGAGSLGVKVCFPWVLRPVLGQSTFAPQRHVSTTEGIPLQQMGGWKQKKNRLGRKCPTQGPDWPIQSLFHESKLMLGHGEQSLRRATHTRASARSTCRPVDGWPGPSLRHPGGWHLAYARQLGPAGGEDVLAGGRAPVPGSALCVLRGLSCNMPVPGPAAELQMGCEGVVCPGYWWLLFWRRRQGPAWSFSDFLPHACKLTSLHTFDPTVSSPTMPVPSAQGLSHPSKPSHTPPVGRSCPLLWPEVRVLPSFPRGTFPALCWLVSVYLCVPGFSPADPVRTGGLPSASSRGRLLSAQALHREGHRRDQWKEGKAETRRALVS